ncbi:MAG: flagellar hook-associated protein FlgK [Salinisphaera sp.]|jgi:flagellar hook-associated protein 1 FlgK|nr:flagellar hook-associated protein FlgK [Salinisphaera sp.]
MASLYGIGLSGLSAAQAGLSTASNNIANVKTPGYTREQAQLAANTNGGGAAGVRVASVSRNTAQYITGQLNTAQSNLASTNAQLDQLSQVDNLLGDPKAGLEPLMQQFFSGLQTVAGDPADIAGRASLLGDAKSLAGQIRNFSSTLSDLARGVDNQVKGSVTQVNDATTQIANLNKQILALRASSGSEPNQLLDQRDKAVADLAKLVNVDIAPSGEGSISVSAGGQALVDATGSHQLIAQSDPGDPTRQAVAVKSGDGSVRTLSADRLSGGSLGGLLALRSGALPSAQANLDLIAHDLAVSVNAQHAKGIDLNGNAGGQFFAQSTPATYASSNNTDNATINVTFAPGRVSNVKPSDYRVTASASGLQITRLSDNTSVASGGSPVTVDGLTFTTSGTPANGDSFLVKPLAGAGSSFAVSISDPARIAAAGPSGAAGDNSNANALADLQNAPTVQGNRSFTDSYAQLVNKIGNSTASLKIRGQTQQALTGELTTSQQSISGVNLDEERVSLLYFQQMYQANARVIQTASTMFDALLAIRP